MNKLKNLNMIWLLLFTTPIFALVVIFLRFSPKYQMLTLVLAALIYLVVVILHHLKDNSLSLEIMVEYFLIAALALIIFQSILI